MKKSGWISFCGWLTFGALLFVLACSVLAAIEPKPPIPASVPAMVALVIMPAFGLWVVGSLVHRFRVGGARMRAQAMVEAQGAVAKPPCGGCGRPLGVLICTRHHTVLCPTCMVTHQTVDCAYAEIRMAGPRVAPGAPLLGHSCQAPVERTGSE